jgi:hypothetical protein
MSDDLRVDIIKAGYKALLRTNHPDSETDPQLKALREDMCKRLAVGKDWMLRVIDLERRGWVMAEPAVQGPMPPQSHAMPTASNAVDFRPIITNEVLDHFVDAAVAGLRQIFAPKRGRRRRNT